MTSLKRHFLKNFSTDFSEVLLEDVKSMPDKALKVSRRYLRLFLSYRENTGGGNIYPPPPQALRGLINADQFRCYGRLSYSGTQPKPVMGAWVSCPTVGKIELN